MDKGHIDFLIIGAAKSGTTSLFHYLASHPQIYMPAAKEVAFFSKDSEYARGAAWYLAEWFGPADPQCIWGEASPQYMFDTQVAERIHAYFPKVKLIALVRNPIDRTFSHYEHARRLALIDEPSFDRFLDQALGQYASEPGPGAAGSDGERVRGHRRMIGFGEYGRILASYYARFPAEQIKVVFCEEMRQAPERVARELYAWLGAEGDVDPGIFVRKHNSGGTVRFPRLGAAMKRAMRTAYEVEWLRQAVVRVFTRDRLRSWLWWVRGELNIKKGGAKTERPVLSTVARARLREHFHEDVARLEALIGRKTPWPEFTPT